MERRRETSTAAMEAYRGVISAKTMWMEAMHIAMEDKSPRQTVQLPMRCLGGASGSIGDVFFGLGGSVVVCSGALCTDVEPSLVSRGT
jgi:hypothetical protein